MKTKKNQLIALVIVVLLLVAGAAYMVIGYTRPQQQQQTVEIITDTIAAEETECVTDTCVEEVTEEPVAPQITRIEEAVIEGKLVMLYHDAYGEGEYISTYRTPGENACVSFIIKCDQEIDVLPYLEEWDEAFGPEPQQNKFMLVPQFEYTAEDFAAQYAGKRVKAVGSLYAPNGGWRNATEVVMSLKSITVLE